MQGVLKAVEKLPASFRPRLFFLLGWHLLKPYPVEDSNPPLPSILIIQVRRQGLEVQASLGHLGIVAVHAMSRRKSCEGLVVSGIGEWENQQYPK